MVLNAGAKKKKRHDLHACTNGNEFIEQMQRMGVDLSALIAEFVKPEGHVGVVLGGSIPEKTATPVSDVDIILLIGDASCIREFRDEIWGQSVFYLHKDRFRQANWLVIFYKGIEINLSLQFNPSVGCEVHTDTTRTLAKPDTNSEDIGELRFLSRLASGWPLFNEDTVQNWKDFYRISELRERRTVSEFTLAIKELEDMKSAIGSSPGLAYSLGVHIVTRLIKTILSTKDYFSPGTKWMRKVNQLIDLDENPLSELLRVAKQLLFPVYNESEHQEREFYKNVIRLTKAVEDYIVGNNFYVGHVLEWFKEEFDMAIEEYDLSPENVGKLKLE